jgi:hypothetical protein
MKQLLRGKDEALGALHTHGMGAGFLNHIGGASCLGWHDDRSIL